MVELADVFRRHAPAYIEKHGRDMLPSHRRAIFDITHCRTVTFGGHVLCCQECGEKTYSYHSCKNRACPKCHTNDTQTWLNKRRQEILPVNYFLVTMTLPEPWREIVRSNQKDLYAILMKAAAKAILKLAADPRYVGAQVGVMAVLHTWTRTMHYHPHVHCLVTGGGVASDGKNWFSSRGEYLFPKKALSLIFRGIFLDAVREKRPDLHIPKETVHKKWVVHVQAAGYGSSAVLDYLGRYVHRVALTNNRITNSDEHGVSFNYRDNRNGRLKSLKLQPDEFIRRFLQHTPPKGFHKVRYYGLWSTAKQAVLKNIRFILNLQATGYSVPNRNESPKENITLKTHPLDGKKCPFCGQGRLVYFGIVNPCRMKPP